ncbi:MAG: transposase [Planctomycetia bacterium]|nr:transposase [Planctomycetia bacterium]
MKKWHKTDLTDAPWELIEPIFRTRSGMDLVKHSKRDLVNAVLYLVKTGRQWRMLPNDLPNYVTVWPFYRRAVIAGKLGAGDGVTGRKNTCESEAKSHTNLTGSSTRKVRKPPRLPRIGVTMVGKIPFHSTFLWRHGYRKSFEENVLEKLKRGVDISKRIKPEWEVLPLRWRVERRFGWANHSRRLHHGLGFPDNFASKSLKFSKKWRKIL